MKKLPPIENDIYQSIIGYLENLEHKGVLNINGHHLSQRLTTMISEGILAKQQKQVFQCLSKHPITAKEISELINLPTKNISSILREISRNTTLIGIDRTNTRKLKYYRNYE